MTLHSGLIQHSSRLEPVQPDRLLALRLSLELLEGLVRGLIQSMQKPDQGLVYQSNLPRGPS